MIVIDRNAINGSELAWLVAFLAEPGHEREASTIFITGEHLHSIGGPFSDDQETSMMVERQALRHPKHAVCIALSVGTNRDLDSSIDRGVIEVVAHLPISIPFSYTHRRLDQSTLTEEKRRCDDDAATRRRARE